MVVRVYSESQNCADGDWLTSAHRRLEFPSAERVDDFGSHRRRTVKHACHVHAAGRIDSTREDHPDVGQIGRQSGSDLLGSGHIGN
jgi:hypothetical protein